MKPIQPPVGVYGGYQGGSAAAAQMHTGCSCHSHRRVWLPEEKRFWGLGCDCFAF